MNSANFTNEAINVLQYIKDKLIKDYPTKKITLEYFILSILENEDSIGFQMLSKSTLTSTLGSFHEWISKRIESKVQTEITDNITYDTIYDKCIEDIQNKFNADTITSGHMLIAIIKRNASIASYLKGIGITTNQLISNLQRLLPSDGKKENHTSSLKSEIMRGPVDEMLIDMNDLAAKGKIDEVIGNEDIIQNIFDILLKRDKNNVILTGDSGVGKTATVSHIANLLYHGNVPKPFANKHLMKMDFMKLVSGTAFRGNFEARFKSIVNDAVKKNAYIFFIDDLQSILSASGKFAEMDAQGMIEEISSERNICLICTMDTKSYSKYIMGNNALKRRFQKIELKEKTDNEVLEILNRVKKKYERYHNVTFTEGAIISCLNLIKKYVRDGRLPDSAIDILDETGAKIGNKNDSNPIIDEYKNKLNEITNKIKLINASSDKKDYEEYDTLKREEIKIQSDISLVEKKQLLENKPTIITEKEIEEVISKCTGIPVSKLSKDERSNLVNLETKLKSYVIGQDEAIDKVCRAVKRQRVGLGDENKPCVLFFGGMTGTGKTYVAKKLAQEVFGSEKSLVRLDMSEYSDKTSVNKLYGSSPGYVGYEKGGVLTSAVKKNNHCVILLDEIEKANEEIHNVFLQLFDEGRLTDNTGYTVDFSNTIIIMTSNVGAKEISERGNGIGFVTNVDKDNKDIVTKAIKRKFKPEFINRIDNIVYFNRLNEDNLKKIIKLELNKLKTRLNKIGYDLGKTFYQEDIINRLYSGIKDKNEYGARPVLSEIRNNIEDKITDYIIDNQPVKNFIFETETISF